MKRFLSVFLVLIVILSFSVSVFADEQSDSIMLVPDYDSYQFVLPEGVTLKGGDTICFIPPMINFNEVIDLSSPADVVFALGIDIYVDGMKVSSFVSELAENYFEFTSKYTGNVEFVITSYFVQYSDGGNPVTIYGPERTLMSFYVEEGPSNTVVDSYPSVWSSGLTMLTELTKTIVNNPLILIFVVLSLVGLGIGIFVRVKK